MPNLVPIVLLERGCKEIIGLTSTDLRIVVALVAAKRVGRAGATVNELRELTGMSHSNMLRLERELWVVAVGQIEGSRERIWGPSPKATTRLGLGGWQTRLFTADELPRVDANVPGFLVALPANESAPERTVTLTGPEIVDTSASEPESERAAS